ncbi:ATP-binding cassette domain-containing protein [Millisia brevis]|uniref:ATP-binding cassette domain-containing protein n=1 Tax=Millisia brevis TaxID=264148 RepID=UPI00247FB729|nr:ATP-binding cassette domain-containing protein [Millisia brevis]
MRALVKRFGDVAALDGLQFEVRRGEVLGLLGRNGSGKTTTINILSTLLRPDSGTATVAGHDVVTDGAKVRSVIALTGQYASLDEELTGRQNIELIARMLGAPKSAAKQRAVDLLAEFGLTEAGDRQVKKYSGGMRRRLDLAVGLIGNPEVIFLDEPTTGLDAGSRNMVWQQVRALRDRGVTVLLTTQYLEEADQLTDRIVLIDGGRVIADGTADQLKDRVGKPLCVVTVADPAAVDEAGRLLEEFGATVSETGVIRIPAPHGLDTLAAVGARLREAAIEVSDIGLRRPTLDEVFLKLTGDPAETTT